MKTIRLTEGNLKKDKDKLETLNKKLDTQIKSLNTTEKHLTKMWIGDASKAFDATYDQDVQVYEKFKKLVAKYATALDSIMGMYEAGEAKNIDTAKTRKAK